MPFSVIDARGVGQSPDAAGEQEDALAAVGGSHCGRRKAQPFRIEPVFGQLSEDPCDASGKALPSVGNKEAWHVLQQEPLASQFPKDAPGVGPAVAGVVLELPLAGDRVALARDASDNHFDHALKRPGVEAAEIAPDSRVIQGAFLHASDQDCRREGFPFDVQNCSSARQSQSGGEVESSDAGTDAEDAEPSTSGM
ncbi:MAG TPA: hypothetical protein VEJ18_07345 [Planctomycetota bacterium]|nr:hypothetical protein [Planctomycetota bacterium]